MLIKSAGQITLPKNIKMMIYGQAGTGKTSLALSMPKPLLLDFDGGVSRVHFAHLDGVDIVQVGSWNEINELFQLDLSAYETIVIDTASKMMDFIIDYKVKGRQPRLQDWGAINQECVAFMRNLSMSGKNIVYIAHRDNYKDGDQTIYIPNMRAKNLGPIITELDLLGYLEIRGGQRTLTFNPTERSEGKNSCNMPAAMTIPTIIDANNNPTAPNNFLTEHVLKPFRESLEKKKATQMAYASLVNEIKAEISAIADAKGANEFIAKIDEFDHVGNSKAIAATMLRDKAAQLGLVFDKKSKLYA